MSAALLLLLFVALCPFVLVALLRPALQCVDGGSTAWQHRAAALVAGVADVVTAHTTWPLLAGWPRQHEWTVSHTLERLCSPGAVLANQRGLLFVAIGREINRISPTGRHIKILGRNNA